MKPKRDRLTEPGALELVEEAVHLLRQAPLNVWAAYYVGTLPLTLALLYFWGDMSRDYMASHRLLEWPLILGILFLWTKCWQTVYAGRLMLQLQQSADETWTWGRIRRLVAIQAALQAAGLFLLPLSLVLMIPFGWTYAFFETVTILGDGRKERLRQTCQRAWSQSKLWPGQNHWLIWLLSPYLLVLVAVLLLVLVPSLQPLVPMWSLGVLWLTVSLVSLLMLALCPLSVAMALNFASALILAPQLIKMLLGIETQFTQSVWGMVNSTLLAVASALTWLALDPLVKAVYVLRCFYGESRRSAMDLRSELKTLRLGRTVSMVALLVVTPAAGQAVCREALVPAQVVPGEMKVSSPFGRKSYEEIETCRLPSPQRGEWLRGKRDSEIGADTWISASGDNGGVNGRVVATCAAPSPPTPLPRTVARRTEIWIHSRLPHGGAGLEQVLVAAGPGFSTGHPPADFAGTKTSPLAQGGTSGGFNAGHLPASSLRRGGGNDSQRSRLYQSMPDMSGPEPMAPTSGAPAKELTRSQASAQQSSRVTPGQLNESIERVLTNREYRWRLPREKHGPQGQEGWIVGLFRDLTERVQRWMRAFRDWLDRLFRRRDPQVPGASSGRSWLGALRPLLIAGILMLLLAVGLLIWRRRRQRSTVVEAVSEMPSPLPDLTEENVAANQLPEDGWLALASDLMGQGESRLALRALYFSSLAHLERQQVLTIARYKSNLDYLRELERRAHIHSGLQVAFADNLALFERVWYGFYEANQELVALFRANLERIRAGAL